MPIPEPGRYRPSNLTTKQKQEQLAACYGVPMAKQFSAEEIAHMKRIVAEHDSEKPGSIQTIDLNNPPKEQYRHQEYPRMVYDLEGSTPHKIVHHLVHSDEELQAALDEGWSKDAPAYGEERQEELSTALQSEAAAVQAQIDAEDAKRAVAKPAKKKPAPAKRK